MKTQKLSTVVRHLRSLLKRSRGGTSEDRALAQALVLLEKPRAPLMAELKARFPWLGTDEQAEGADTVDALTEWYEGTRAPRLKVWVSVLIPREGADVYDGARTQVSLSEADAYRDLAEWLEREDVDPLTATREQVEAEMSDALDNDEILMWKIECQEVEL